MACSHGDKTHKLCYFNSFRIIGSGSEYRINGKVGTYYVSEMAGSQYDAKCCVSGRKVQRWFII